MARVDKARKESTAPEPAPRLAADAAQPDEVVQTISTPAAAAHARAINAVSRGDKDDPDGDELGVDVNKVPDVPPGGGVAQIIHAVQMSEGAMGDIETFDLPGARKAPKPREQWNNPTDASVTVMAHPPFRVRAGGTFTIEKAYHDAMHDCAPQIRCSGGDACSKVTAHARLLEQEKEERAQRKIARTVLGQ